MVEKKLLALSGEWTIHDVAAENAAAAWELAGLVNEVEKGLSDRIAFRMFDGR